MSASWLVRVPDVATASGMADGAWSWTVAGVAGASIEHGGLAELAAALQAERTRPVTLVVPTARVITMPVAVPVRQQRQMQQALPFLVEENLAGEIEHCHVVAGTRIDAQRLQLLAVDRAWFAGLLEALGAAGIDPAVVTSEALALPLPARGATLFLDGSASMLATTDGQTLAFDQADAALLASAPGVGDGDRVDILLGINGDLLTARAIESELLTAAAPPQVHIDETLHERLPLLAATVSAAGAPANLRQGAFAHEDESTFSLGFDWRPLAWLAACWAVLALGYQVAVGVSHARAAAAVHESQVMLYRQVFPGAKNVPHPRAQMEGQLKGAGGGVSFTTLVAQTSEAINALDKGSGRYQPRTLAWDADQGQLRIDIVARNLEDLEQLRHALQQRGLNVDIGAGVSQDGGYKARMNISASAPAGRGNA